jgi:hypothetical protein
MTNGPRIGDTSTVSAPGVYGSKRARTQTPHHWVTVKSTTLQLNSPGSAAPLNHGDRRYLNARKRVLVRHRPSPQEKYGEAFRLSACRQESLLNPALWKRCRGGVCEAGEGHEFAEMKGATLRCRCSAACLTPRPRFSPGRKSSPRVPPSNRREVLFRVAWPRVLWQNEEDFAFNGASRYPRRGSSRELSRS